MKKNEVTVAQSKSEMAYRLKCEGLSWSEVASMVGSARKSVPTLAKNFMERFGLPKWGEFVPIAVADSKPTVKQPAKPKAQQTETDPVFELCDTMMKANPVDALIAARMVLQKLKDTKNPVILTHVGDIARDSASILRSS